MLSSVQIKVAIAASTALVIWYRHLFAIDRVRRPKRNATDCLVRHEGRAKRTGKSCIVTGAGSGIGYATALKFISLGFNVTAIDIDAAGLRKLYLDVKSRSYETSLLLCVRCDVASEEDVRNAINSAVKRFGRIDVCFNNAGIEGDRAAVADLPVGVFDNVMAVNLRSIFICMKYEIKQMLKQKSPPLPILDAASAIDMFQYAIVNTASTAGLFAMPEFSAYSASKHAIVGLTKTAAKEYAPAGIRINAIAPSTVMTPMVERFMERWPQWQAKQNESFPVGRVGRPEEIANAVVWLSSCECPFLTGATLTIDGASSA